tara:strand:+ start:620 stop:1282 length:663 start_codon:yes stop_codon:yes gene_type:complete
MNSVKLLKKNKEIIIIALSHYLASLYLLNFSKHLGDFTDEKIGSILMPLISFIKSFESNFIYSLISVIIFLLVIIDLNKSLTRKLIDIAGTVLVLRTIFDFFLLNILLLYPLKDVSGGFFLIMELLIFTPQISFAYTWLYWRFDHFSRKKGVKLLTFQDEPPVFFDYIEISFKQICQFDPTIVKGNDIPSRILLFSQSIVMLDILTLIVTRAVQITSGQY